MFNIFFWMNLSLLRLKIYFPVLIIYNLSSYNILVSQLLSLSLLREYFLLFSYYICWFSNISFVGNLNLLCYLSKICLCISDVLRYQNCMLRHDFILRWILSLRTWVFNLGNFAIFSYLNIASLLFLLLFYSGILIPVRFLVELFKLSFKSFKSSVSLCWIAGTIG